MNDKTKANNGYRPTITIAQDGYQPKSSQKEYQPSGTAPSSNDRMGYQPTTSSSSPSSPPQVSPPGDE
ncbi:hypothetical protein PSEHALCIP103_02851 [Pseudoalteromonas haloplanktis]|uniref:Uncharacterized protein n=2 Tax=Pseudoalteromonas TaxID=53246 RepID=A0A9W4R1V7_PSEHA|nr:MULTISPECIES: hypothetical protein [Pseudoalteromonas]CAH9063130.1 hypothetical protein PSEHALCIP103_02851 [Pseudoalteromonas haloplanktis]